MQISQEDFTDWMSKFKNGILEVDMAYRHIKVRGNEEKRVLSSNCVKAFPNEIRPRAENLLEFIRARDDFPSKQNYAWFRLLELLDPYIANRDLAYLNFDVWEELLFLEDDSTYDEFKRRVCDLPLKFKD